MNIKQTIRNRVNRVLAPIGRTFYEKIPLNDIFKACTDTNLQPVQEDGTNWDGWLLGEDGRTTFDLIAIDPSAIDGRTLSVAGRPALRPHIT
jgi:hypothetical protein